MGSSYCAPIEQRGRGADCRLFCMPTALVIGARNLGFAVIERLLNDG